MVLPIRTGMDQQGLPEAQYRLGLMYLEGRGVRRDPKHALKLLGQAAGQGYGAAQEKIKTLSALQ